MSDDYNLNKGLEETAQEHQSIVKRTHCSPYSHIHSFWKDSLNTYCVPYNRMTEGAPEITKVHSLPKGTATDPPRQAVLSHSASLNLPNKPCCLCPSFMLEDWGSETKSVEAHLFATYWYQWHQVNGGQTCHNWVPVPFWPSVMPGLSKHEGPQGIDSASAIKRALPRGIEGLRGHRRGSQIHSGSPRFRFLQRPASHPVTLTNLDSSVTRNAFQFL